MYLNVYIQKEKYYILFYSNVQPFENLKYKSLNT